MVGGASEGCREKEEEEEMEEKKEEEGPKLNLWGSVTSGRNINRNVNRKMIESLQTGSKREWTDSRENLTTMTKTSKLTKCKAYSSKTAIQWLLVKYLRLVSLSQYNLAKT